jgi:serine phosphatase RsbU (regulator of sigma subunit)/anti-sigma regulatory factor (Ser/Thr protein kinase)/anti-anti-sigma regulatory factor
VGHHAASDLNALIAAMDQSPLLLSFYEGDPLVVTAHNSRAGAIFGPILGLTADEAFGSTSLHEVGRRLPDVVSSGRSFSADSLQLDVKDAAGRKEKIFLDVVAQPWLRPDGSIRGVATVAVDVTKAVTASRAQDAKVAELRRHWTAARDTLTTIQDALLPAGLPVLPGSRIAAEYLMAEKASGGDWFDAIGLDDGRVVLVVGDVVGHGIGASVVMGELRAVFDEHVRRDGDFVAALGLLDQRARRVTQARATTVCVAVLDPQSGVVKYCTAGHPPPLTIRAGNGATYLPTTGGRPLGSGKPFQIAEHHLDEGDLFILYSNGLVSRPGRTPMRSTLEVVGLANAVHEREAALPPGEVPLVQRVCSGLVEAASSEGFVDDITVLAAQRVEPLLPLSLSMPAQPDVPRAVRHHLAEWLKPLGVSGIDETALQHSISELVSNAVEHAYVAEDPPERRTVEIEACLAGGGVLEISVTDHGRWQESDPHSDRGRGLAMVQGFCDEFELQRRSTGTRACVRHHPHRPAQLLTGLGPRIEPAALTATRGKGELALSGPVDARSADWLRHELALRTRGGTVPMVVDLSEVTTLASVGVQILHEQLEMPAELRLVAPMGSPAQHVLDMVQLPYSTTRDGGGPGPR